MDAVHEPDTRPWIGRPIKVAEFKNKWIKELEQMKRGHDDDDDGSLKEAIMGRMKLSEEVLSQIESDCG